MISAHTTYIRHRLKGYFLSFLICAGFFNLSIPIFSLETSPSIEKAPYNETTPPTTGQLSNQITDLETAKSKIFDIDAAKELCDLLPLRSPEGIWVYPDDNVTVLILRRPSISPTSLLSYDIQVVETSDVRMKPGDIIGKLSETPESSKFELELFTEFKENIFRKPKTCMARLTEDSEVMVLSKEKSKFNFRFTLNPSTLLPKMWKILRMNASYGNRNSSSQSPAIGMVKVYPSYDGNGSSRREPRYL